MLKILEDHQKSREQEGHVWGAESDMNCWRRGDEQIAKAKGLEQGKEFLDYSPEFKNLRIMKSMIKDGILEHLSKLDTAVTLKAAIDGCQGFFYNEFPEDERKRIDDLIDKLAKWDEVECIQNRFIQERKEPLEDNSLPHMAEFLEVGRGVQEVLKSEEQHKVDIESVDNAITEIADEKDKVVDDMYKRLALVDEATTFENLDQRLKSAKDLAEERGIGNTSGRSPELDDIKKSISKLHPNIRQEIPEWKIKLEADYSQSIKDADERLKIWRKLVDQYEYGIQKLIAIAEGDDDTLRDTWFAIRDAQDAIEQINDESSKSKLHFDTSDPLYKQVHKEYDNKVFRVTEFIEDIMESRLDQPVGDVARQLKLYEEVVPCKDGHVSQVHQDNIIPDDLKNLANKLASASDKITQFQSKLNDFQNLSSTLHSADPAQDMKEKIDQAKQLISANGVTTGNSELRATVEKLKRELARAEEMDKEHDNMVDQFNWLRETWDREALEQFINRERPWAGSPAEDGVAESRLKEIDARCHQAAKYKVDAIKEGTKHFFGGCSDSTEGRHWSSDDLGHCELFGCDQKSLRWGSRHHCRSCGRLVCGECSNQKRRLALVRNAERTCDECDAILKHLEDGRQNLSFQNKNRTIMLQVDGQEKGRPFGQATAILQTTLNLSNCLGSTDAFTRSFTTHNNVTNATRARPYPHSGF